MTTDANTAGPNMDAQSQGLERVPPQETQEIESFLDATTEKVSSWARTKIADHYNTSMGLAYVPETLREDLPVFKAIKRENIDKPDREGSEGIIWLIGTANRGGCDKILDDYWKQDYVILESTIKDLKKVGNIKYSNNGTMLWLQDSTSAPKHKIIKENFITKPKKKPWYLA